MHTLLSRWSIAIAGALGLAGLVCCLEAGALGGSQKPAGATDKDRPEARAGGASELKPRYYPSKEGCGSAICHGSGKGKELKVVCDLGEYTRWNAKDKHTIATEVLEDRRAREMGERLDLKDVTKSADCLSCHSGADPSGVGKDFNQKKEGVSCSVCHGPHREWYIRHFAYEDQEQWRIFKRPRKEKEFGMTDLWNPLRRAEVCASCHIGSKGKKFVTHAMYAAGHPLLPSFEVAAFCDMMPPHWEYLRRKSDEAKKLLEYDGVEREQTKLVLVGAAVTLRESMRLLEQQASEAIMADPVRPVLDLANFDCYACHHDLAGSSWRQKRPTSGKPGRVPMPTWPTALVPLAIAHAEPNTMKARALSAEYGKLLKEVRDAFTVRPYGDPKKIATTAASLAQWSHTLAETINNKKCTKEDAVRVLGLLPGLYKTEATDYDSARQIAWAFRSIYDECKEEKIIPGDEATDKALQQLETDLRLRFPPGRVRIETGLNEGYNRRAAYDPGPFLEALGRLLRKAP